MVQLDYRDSRPIYTQISDTFREQILTGVLEAGERLPSVRDLAAQLAINPNTIQRSYRELEIQGWIASVPGKGSFVCGVPLSARTETKGILKEFDKLTSQLVALGVTRGELARRVSEGGNKDA